MPKFTFTDKNNTGTSSYVFNDKGEFSHFEVNGKKDQVQTNNLSRIYKNKKLDEIMESQLENCGFKKQKNLFGK